ncbi:uncharacterized protein K02A2.6-like [Pollicipes pollicipes]|uniref:uncharacterized protein K02A2.6-like n=1 Tax=Pollicipes pollicipes TaxID=41117 RepID=UPI001884B931|nr:uncharacterized protein K02A2.6-like [Pollicipes pollicipes]XP_037079232.1 uncharacterized protein K02A2.6-like [Pollicipes pollicipes]
MVGWPAEKNGLPEAVVPYFNCRDELSVHDGIIVRGDRVVIPKTMRKEMLVKLHAGHSGINSCLRRARDFIFWPGMSNDIREYLAVCDTCALSPSGQAPEPIFAHAVPERPWEKVGTDLFHVEGRNYLVTVDYSSQVVEVDYLQETTSQAVVSKLKGHFARHGIPDIVPIDGKTNQTWKKAVVTSVVKPPRYQFENEDGVVLGRNRQFLRASQPSSLGVISRQLKKPRSRPQSRLGSHERLEPCRLRCQPTLPSVPDLGDLFDPLTKMNL